MRSSRAMETSKCPRCTFTSFRSASCKRCGFVFASMPTAPANVRREPGSYVTVDAAAGRQAYHAQMARKKTGLAIASMCLGIAGLVLSIILIGLVFAPIALILGIVALVKASRRPQEYGGQGFAIAGVVLGAIATLCLPVIAAIAIPNLLAARRAANEGAAISALRSINAAQAVYKVTAGASFCGEMAQLEQEKLVSGNVASGRSSGYRFVLAFDQIKRSCSAYATPENSSMGSRSFFLSSDGVIHGANMNGARAEATDPILGN